MNGVVPDKLILEVQVGLAGSSQWLNMTMTNELFAGKMTGPGGAARKYTRFYATDYGNNERIMVIGRRETGNPEPFTFDLNLPDWISRTTYDQIKQRLEGVKNIRLRYYTGDYANATNYKKIKVWAGCVNAARLGQMDGDQIDGTKKVDAQGAYKLPQEADEFYEIYPLQVSNLTGTVSTLAFTDVISIGFPRSAGEVEGEDVNNDGTKEYIAVTLKDGSNLPHLRWTADKGASWADVTLTGLTNFDATGVAKVGENIVVSGSGAGGGLAWAKWDEVKAGTATWTRSTNIAGGTVVNKVKRISSTKAVAVGNAGAVYLSEDAGKTFTSAGAAVTANNLTQIAVVDETLQWFGGASSTLVRRMNGVMSLITVTGLAAAINSLAVPNTPNRGTQIFVGAADGKIYYAPNGTVTAPTWNVRYSAGSGSIDSMAFAGYEGAVLYFNHVNGSTQSRIYRDLSGGKLATDVEGIGDYTNPANASFNAIAAPVHDVNTLMIVGDLTGGQGFIGLAA
ncbi:MAG: hypothetical protein K8L97_09830 [Anaerolineae bacterium]|nr:hypothetical protein [Anaerolineae bacterium]